jgi:Flp pilus assembly protein TadD
MQQGLAKGLARNPGDARLHLGAALLAAGRRADAEPLLRGLAGTSPDDGSATLARLWLLAVH